MAFYSGRLVVEPEMENPMLVIVTERNAVMPAIQHVRLLP